VRYAGDCLPIGLGTRVIDDGKTGFIFENESEAIQASGRLRELDRRRVRAHFEQRFTAKRMTMDYQRIYERLVDSKHTTSNRRITSRQ
jgi:hypothetical protein